MLIRSIIILFLSFSPLLSFTNVNDDILKSQLEKLILPDGFKIELYASDVENARSMAISPSGTIFVGNRRSDNVFALKDTDGDNVVDKKYLITDKLKNMPNGVAYHKGDLYVGVQMLTNGFPLALTFFFVFLFFPIENILQLIIKYLFIIN